jgi:short-subunit dehydrogenase involved in D-alanine esterification of teichoic acids
MTGGASGIGLALCTRKRLGHALDEFLDKISD